MNDLRTAAQQALEALMDDQYRMVEVAGGHYEYKTDLAIGALKAALAQEQAVQTWVCPEAPEERTYSKPGHCENCGKTLVLAQEQAEPVATMTECEACFTPDVCQLRGTCDHYAASQLRVAAQPKPSAEPVQEPYTDDVTRIMREAGMTFHLGLPHKAVVEQMTRVVDLVYAEASIKAAQQFATAPPKREPLTEEEIDRIWRDGGWAGRPSIGLIRAVERAHGIGEQR